MLKSKHVSHELRKSLEKLKEDSDSDTLTDITDGALHQQIRRQVCGDYDIAVPINNDGSPGFKSSKYSIWLIQLTVNEPTQHLRSRNMLLAALWYGKQHPNMTIFLEPFVKDIPVLQRKALNGQMERKTSHQKCSALLVVLTHQKKLQCSKSNNSMGTMGVTDPCIQEFDF